MLTTIKQQIKTAVILLILLTLLTSVIYPTILTGIGQIFFPWQAHGSLIEKDGKVIGSTLIGQSFTDNQYFWGRPSMTLPFPYNAENSKGSNLGPTNPAFITLIKNRINILSHNDSPKQHLIPVDLVTASASGLDPEISPLAAFYQIPRIAQARNLSEKKLQLLTKNLIKKRTFYILGEPRVNVLKLNLELDALTNTRKSYEKAI